MIVKELFEQIETDEFEMNIALASGTTLFRIILQDNPYIYRLVTLIRRNSKIKELVTRHIYDLLRADVNPGYVHPKDTFVAAYLYVIALFDIELAQRIIYDIKKAPQLAWSYIICDYISRPSFTGINDFKENYDQIEAVFGPTPNITVTFVAAAVHNSEVANWALGNAHEITIKHKNANMSSAGTENVRIEVSSPVNVKVAS
jgi:hypothetical protein